MYQPNESFTSHILIQYNDTIIMSNFQAATSCGKVSQLVEKPTQGPRRSSSASQTCMHCPVPSTMFNDITKPPPPLPAADLQTLEDGVSFLSPLSRRGHGPGIILLVSDTDDQMMIADGVPSHLVKWAEEGYATVEIQLKAIKEGKATDVLAKAVEALDSNEKCQPKGKIGIVGATAHVIHTLFQSFTRSCVGDC